MSSNSGKSGPAPSFAAPLSLGVEEEFQILCPETLALTPGFDKLLETEKTQFSEANRGERHLIQSEFIQSELHQSCCEVVTPPCGTVAELSESVRENRFRLQAIAQESGLQVALAGTHPMACWHDLPITNEPRRLQSNYLYQEAHRQCLTFALHIHVGVPNRKIGVRVMNDARAILPVLYGLSCSSPFLEGRTTGLMSSRLLRAFGFPRTGIPETFENVQQLDDLIRTLRRSSLIVDAGQIWWDIRVHHRYPTVEFRICDAVPRWKDVMSIAAFIQAYVAWLLDRYDRNSGPQRLDRTLVCENKWRAARFGTDVELLDYASGILVPLEQHVDALCEQVRPFSERLGTLGHIDRLSNMVRDGSSAHRQRKAVEEGSGDLSVAIKQYVLETFDC